MMQHLLSSLSLTFFILLSFSSSRGTLENLEDYDAADPSFTTEAPGPIPEPKGDPDVTNGTVNDSSNVCILLKMAVRFTISFPVNASLNSSKFFNMPKKTTVSGSCNGSAFDIEGTGYQFITFIFPIFPEDGIETADFPNWVFTLSFNKTGDSFVISDINLNVPFDGHYFPITDYETTLRFAKNGLSLYKTKSDKSYLCNSKQSQSIDLPMGNVSYAAKIDFTNMQLQAYRKGNDKAFSDSMQCPADGKDTDIVVPIAVGVSLAVLIIIVVVAYLIGSRRRKPAYQQVE